MNYTKKLVAFIAVFICMMASLAVAAETGTDQEPTLNSGATVTSEENTTESGETDNSTDPTAPPTEPTSPTEPTPPVDDGYMDILFIGNSLIYYNDMETEIFPSMCAAAGNNIVSVTQIKGSDTTINNINAKKSGVTNIRITSIIESGTTLYRVASEKTSVGKQVLKALEENTYDYVIIEPSRRITPFEYSVYHAEKEAALKLNGIINAMGAKTVVLAEPGLDTAMIPVYTMNSDGINSTTLYSLPMDRSTHAKYVENLCQDYVSEMQNAQVVNIGVAAEVLMKNFPNFNSLYRDDNRHPSTRGSYLQAACIYDSIFNKSILGVNYVYSLYNQNAVTAQRAAEVAVLGSPESILTAEQYTRKLTAALSSNSVAAISWTEPKSAEYYEVYQKAASGNYAYLGRTVSNECKYNAKSLSAGKTYYYKIKAYHKVGDITFSFDYSPEVSVITLAKASKPKATLVNKKTSKLTYTAVAGAQYYNIYRKQSGSYSLIGTSSKLEYTDKTMKPGNTYTYKVAAVKENGKVVGAKSSGRSILAIAAPKVSLSSAKKGRVTVNITSVKGATNYKVYAKVKGDKSYTLLTTTTKLKYTAKNLTSGKKYYFKVKAYNKKDTSTTSSLYRTKKIKVS